jgi:hypothetical protein
MKKKVPPARQMYRVLPPSYTIVVDERAGVKSFLVLDPYGSTVYRMREMDKAVAACERLNSRIGSWRAVERV